MANIQKAAVEAAGLRLGNHSASSTLFFLSGIPNILKIKS